MKQFLLLLLVSACFMACSTTGSTAREVKRETRDQRKSPIIIAAKSGNQYFHLRQNNYFDYLVGSEVYAGTYSQKGDSLMLGFHNNYQPTDLVGKGLIDRQGGVIIIFSKDASNHRRLTILP